MQNSTAKPILIVGGYGVVGRQIAQMLIKRYPELPLWLGGRNPNQAQQWIDPLQGVKAVAVDSRSANPLASLEVMPAAVLNVANDPDDFLLLDCVRRGIPYVDITRWTERVVRSKDRLAAEIVKSPVILCSGWMGGNIALIANAYRRQFCALQAIDIDVLYAIADKAGPNSVEYMDRLSTPFTTIAEGRTVEHLPLSDPKIVRFPGGYRGKVYRFDTPDQLSLPQTTGAHSVNARIGFDSAISMATLVGLRRLGILNFLNRPRFDCVRRGLLYNPGEGAAHEVCLTLIGKDANQQSQHLNISVSAPQGQTHLTACGAVVQLEWALGLGNMTQASPGVQFAEQHAFPDAAIAFLRDQGVIVNVKEPLRA